MTDSVALFIDPPSHHLLGDRLFDSANTRYGGENLLAPHIAVRDHFATRGIAVHTADMYPQRAAKTNLLVSLGRTETAKAHGGDAGLLLSAFIGMECPIVEPRMYRELPAMQQRFRRIFSWTDSEALLPFTRSPVVTRRFWWPQSFDAVDEALWSRDKRGFLVMINANKLPRLFDRELYTERLRAVEYFHRYHEITLYGKNWDRMPNRVGWTPVPATVRRLQGWAWGQWQRVRPHPLYAAARGASHGAVDSKLGALANYKFALCFENMRLRGWMTEKIFDCLCAGVVPVYWGAPDVQDWIDPSCFIDMRRFAGYGELREYLHSLSPDNVQAFRSAGRAFISSSAFDRFRIRAWVDLFRGLVEEDAGVAI